MAPVLALEQRLSGISQRVSCVGGLLFQGRHREHWSYQQQLLILVSCRGAFGLEAASKMVPLERGFGPSWPVREPSLASLKDILRASPRSIS